MVTRESEFDDYTRQRIFALMVAESRQCPKCRNFDTFVPLKDEENDKRWTQHGDERYGVRQMQCKACALSDLVEREAGRVSEAEPKPQPGQPSISDGRVFIVQPINPDEPETEVT